MNLTSFDNKFGKILLILTTISFLWIGTIGLFGMSEMKSNSMVDDCLFNNGQTKVCPMNLLDHITLWQNTLMSLPQNTESLLTVILATIILFTIVIFWKNPFSELSEYITSRFRLYIRQHPQKLFFNFLREIFSQGILNTKIYESTII